MAVLIHEHRPVWRERGGGGGGGGQSQDRMGSGKKEGGLKRRCLLYETYSRNYTCYMLFFSSVRSTTYGQVSVILHRNDHTILESAVAFTM